MAAAAGVALTHQLRTRQAGLAPLLQQARAQLAPAVRVSWPKTACRQSTGLSDEVLRELALPPGSST